MKEQDVVELVESERITRRGVLVKGGLLAAGATVLGGPVASAFGATQAGGFKMAVVTHGDTGSFWSVFKKGVDQAASDLKGRGVSVTQVYANNDVAKQVAGINAAIAGHFRVPVVMISGDDAAVAEAKKIVGDLEGAIVKESYGFHSAKTLTPEAARDRIRDAVKRALQNRSRFRPTPAKTPVTLEIQFKNYRPAEILAYLPNVERIDAHSVRFVGKDILEVVRFLSFVTNYEPGLEP
jgi:D-amino peptidase